MKKLSERMQDLSAQAKHTEDTIDAVLSENRQRLQAQRDALSTKAETQRDTFTKQLDGAQTEFEAKLLELRGAVQGQFATIRADAVKRHAERDVKRAERRAGDAELDAVAAVDFAGYALEQVEYAIVGAAIARAEADELATTPGSPGSPSGE
jgi:hypothetical protein